MAAGLGATCCSQVFHGALCTHFAVENNTDVTRVSLDFRVLPEVHATTHSHSAPTLLCCRTRFVSVAWR